VHGDPAFRPPGRPHPRSREGMTASYRDGVLEVVVPKAAQRAEPRQIPVSAVNGTAAVTASRHAG